MLQNDVLSKEYHNDQVFSSSSSTKGPFKIQLSTS